MNVLVSWIGEQDIRAIQGSATQGLGPLGDFLLAERFDRIILLHSGLAGSDDYAGWLWAEFGIESDVLKVGLKRPHDLDEVYDRARDALMRVVADDQGGLRHDLSYLLSPGTKAMSSALLLIGCSDAVGKVFYSWQDESEPDARKRYVRVRWPERFSVSLFAARPQRGAAESAVIGPDGQELSRDPEMRKVYTRARRLAQSSLSVLINGETGTGKELLAQFVHRESARAAGPFVPVNCGAIPDTLIDSELFGHRKGAFTGATADRTGFVQRASGGTVFLDEVGELPLSAQVRLLRFLQEGEITRVGDSTPIKVDVRVVAATHRDLHAMMADGTFRSDLYYRLAEYPLRLPPLRQRGDDIRLIVEQLLQEDAKARPVVTAIDDAAWNVLTRHSWPGNVRELQNIVRRCCIDAVVVGDGATITPRIVREALADQTVDGSIRAAIVARGGQGGGQTDLEDVATRFLACVEAEGVAFGDMVSRLEAATMQAALRRASSQREAGRLIGLSASSFSNRKKRLGEDGYWL